MKGSSSNEWSRKSGSFRAREVGRLHCATELPDGKYSGVRIWDECMAGWKGGGGTCDMGRIARCWIAEGFSKPVFRGGGASGGGEAQPPGGRRQRRAQRSLWKRRAGSCGARGLCARHGGGGRQHAPRGAPPAHDDVSMRSPHVHTKPKGAAADRCERKGQIRWHHPALLTARG